MPTTESDEWKKEQMAEGRKKRFFTLVELLIVVSVLVILLSLLLPALRQSIEKGRSVSCIGNLRQVGAGVLQYAESWNGYFTNRDSSARWANRGAYWSKISEALGGPTSEELANLSARPERIERIPKVFSVHPPSTTGARRRMQTMRLSGRSIFIRLCFPNRTAGQCGSWNRFIRMFPFSRIGNARPPRRRSVPTGKRQIIGTDSRPIPQTVCGMKAIRCSTGICSRGISEEAIWSSQTGMSKVGKGKRFPPARFSAGAAFAIPKESRSMIMRSL